MRISLAKWTRATGPPDVGQGLRGAAGWFVCVCAGFYSDHLSLGFVAGMMAWIVAFSDTSVGVFARMRGALFQILFTSSCIGLAVLANQWELGELVVTAFIAAFVALSAVGGPTTARRTSASMLVILLAVGAPGQLVDPGEALVASLCGGALGLLLLLLSQPYSRESSSAAARQFARVADLVDLYAAGAPPETIALARIELSRSTADAYSDAALSWPASAGPQTASQISLANSITQHLVSAMDAEDLLRRSREELVRAMCENIARTCRNACQMLVDRHPSHVSIGATLYSIDRVIALWEALNPSDVAGTGALRALRDDVCRVPQIHNLGGLSQAEVRKRSQPSWVDWFAGLRSDRLLRRHAIRYLLLLLVAAGVGLWSSMPDAYLIPITSAIVLRPDLNGSVERVVAFCAAVLSGAAVGVLLAGVAGDLSGLIVVFTTALIFLAIGYAPMLWWAFPAGVTAFMMCAAGLLLPHDWATLGWRLAAAGIGVAIALTGMILLWPQRAVSLVRETFARSLDASAAYLEDVSAGVDEEELRARRRYASRVTAAAGAALKEYAMMPYHSRTVLSALQATLPSLQRIYGAVTELASLHHSGRALPPTGDTVDLVQQTAEDLRSRRVDTAPAMAGVLAAMSELLRATTRD
jgi:uncharacterized membrane protein YccC